MGNAGWTDWHKLGTLNERVYLVVATNADGRLEVFARSGDGDYVVHKWQRLPNDGWEGEPSETWQTLGAPGGTSIRYLDAVKNADGRIELFANGEDGNLWHIWQLTPNAGWGDWLSLGRPDSVAIRHIAVGQNADGRLEAFASGSDENLWHIWQLTPNAGWGDWNNLGRPTAVELGGFVVGKNEDGRLELFAREDGNRWRRGNLWHLWQDPANGPNGGWSYWNNLGRPDGAAIRYIAVGQNADGRLEVFAKNRRGSIPHIWQNTPNGDWSEWAVLDPPHQMHPSFPNPIVWRGPPLREFSVGRNQDGRLEVFAMDSDALGSDGNIWHRWQPTDSLNRRSVRQALDPLSSGSP